jgi:hypothetical protein
MTEGWGGGGLSRDECDYPRGQTESERIGGDPVEVARRLEAKVVREAAEVACSAGSLSIQRELPNLLAALRLARLLASGMPLREDPQGLRPKAGSPARSEAQGDAHD